MFVPIRPNGIRNGRRWIVALLLMLPLYWVSEARAKIDPLKVLSSQLVRPEVLIVLDTSGSMQFMPGADGAIGSDCTGGEPSGYCDGHDCCGDGLCTHRETTSSCPSDCYRESHSASTYAGSRPQCRTHSSCRDWCNWYYSGYSESVCKNGCDSWNTNDVPSRMWITKRALRNIIPEMRKTASFGLVTFQQSGYYRYYQARTNSQKRWVTIYLHEWELRGSGSWTGGVGWDSTNDRPKTNFSVSGVTYRLLSDSVVQSQSYITRNADTLYRRETATGYLYKRMPWSGRTVASGGYNWQYQGSYYSYEQFRLYSTSNYYAYPANGKYLGPQLESGGTTWVHYRYNYDWDQIIHYGTNGLVRLPLSYSDTQADHDAQVGELMNDLNYANNGGIFSFGGTPLGEAIDKAKQHYQERINATGYFAGHPDPAASCRKRFALVLTDGQWNGSKDPVPATKSLYALGVKTFVLGIPGLPSSAQANLNEIADAGDDGDDKNGSAQAFFANNEKELVDNIRKVLYDALRGEYTTAAGGVSTASAGGTVGTISLIASTQFPGWRGQLRGYDLTKNPTDAGYQIWDAGLLLEQRDWKTRQLYTGLSTTASGDPVLMLAADSSGNACINIGDANCSGPGLKSVWIATVGTTPPADLDHFAQWLAGKDRAWKLDPIVRAVPASVGPPPKYDGIASHKDYEDNHSLRERLIYVPSNAGLIHAFSAETGSERFAYLPPHLLPKAYSVFAAGGQPDDPKEFKWVMASSPRVEDVPDCTSSGCTWKTELVLGDGPGGEEFVVLDISDPSICSGSPCVYTLNTPPFRVEANSKTMGVGNTFGETWSIPVMFFDNQTYGPVSLAAMGSGYDVTAGEGKYYNVFEEVWNPSLVSSKALNVVGTPKVSYAALANTVGAADLGTGSNRQVIATYQADLAGRITRFTQGKTVPSTGVKTLIDQTVSHPFYYAPSSLYRSGNNVTLAFVSGDYYEIEPWVASSSTTFRSKLYMRTDSGGIVSTDDNVSCAINQVCGASCFSQTPSPCDVPLTTTALPVSRPLLIDNTHTGTTDAFYLYYEPPALVCDGLGTTYLLQVSSSGTTQKLERAEKYTNTFASGMSIVGGGQDIALATSAQGVGARATPQKLGPTPLQATPPPLGKPTVESWREVR